MKEVETNIGRMPVEDYREIKAYQLGFDSYEDMRKQGYHLGNEYDTPDGTSQEKEEDTEMFGLTREMVEDLRERYPAGTRIVLDRMADDPRPIEPGTKGTVSVVDDAGTVHVCWDNGRSLGLVSGEDSFHKDVQRSRDDAR